jgi:DNA-binding MarR family transcriptional regulator
MTRIVDALCDQDLVTRTRNVNDGRSTLIAATAAGRRLLMQGRERRVRALAAQIHALRQDERAILQQATEVLKRVINSI